MARASKALTMCIVGDFLLRCTRGITMKPYRKIVSVENKIVFTTLYNSEDTKPWSWSAWIVGYDWTMTSRGNDSPRSRGCSESDGAKRSFKRWAKRWYSQYELVYVETNT